MTHKGKAPPKRTTTKNTGGRPSKPMPELIPDTPENVVFAAMKGPPKRRWRYLTESQVITGHQRLPTREESCQKRSNLMIPSIL